MSPIKTVFTKSLGSLPSGNFNIGGVRTKVVEIRLVGSQPMGVEVYKFTGPLIVGPEPTNPYDKNALVVKDGDIPIGYIPRDKQHYFLNNKFKQTAEWSELPKAINSSDKWSIQIVIEA